MKIIPAIYIQKGKVVSWYKGSDNPEKKTYSKAPHTFAKDFAQEGAKTLFIIDLDGDQRDLIHKIRPVFPGSLWWAGQVRSMEDIEQLFQSGADRIVLGQSAQPIFEEALAKYGPKKLITGLQVQHYDDAPDTCEKLGSIGFSEILLKDMNAEGTLFHPNYDLMEKCVYFSDATVYASGGVSKYDHPEILKRAGVKGVIVDRALYEHQLDLSELIRRYEGA